MGKYKVFYMPSLSPLWTVR